MERRTMSDADRVQVALSTADARVEELEGEVVRLTKEATSTRIAAINDERRRIIGAVEEAIGRSVCDGGQYRADVKSAIHCALDDVRKERDKERGVVAELRAALTDLVARCDRSELADGTSIDTLTAHVALGHIVKEPADAR